MKKNIIFSVLTAIWAGMIAVISLLPAQAAITSSLWDKLEHGLAFFVLYALMGLGRLARTDLKIWLVAAGYGVVIEFAQLFSPGRYADPFDALADAIGAFFGVVAIRLWRQRRSPNQS